MSGGLQQHPQFNLDMCKPLVNILLIENQYVIAVSETNVTIFNAASGDILQQDANLENKHAGMKFKYKNAAIKTQTNDNASISDVYLLSCNTVEKKATLQSEIFMMKEVDWEQ